ncbi:MAG: phosphoribosylanthranilate isomerase [Candidatus Heimdallarchaeaceae archaeon]
MWIAKISGVTNFDAAMSVDVSDEFAIGVIIEEISNVRQISKFDARRIFASVENCIKIAEIYPRSLEEVFDIIDTCQPEMIQINGDFCDKVERVMELQSVVPLPIIASIILDRSTLEANIVNKDVIKAIEVLDPFVHALNINLPLGEYWKSSSKRKKIIELLEKVLSSTQKPVIIGGGLNSSNVGKIIKAIQPAAVDVSSSVERVQGIKDPLLMQEFLEEVYKYKELLTGV